MAHVSAISNDASHQKKQESSFTTYLYRLGCFAIGSIAMLGIVTMRSQSTINNKLEFFKEDEDSSSNSGILLDPRQAAQTITVSPYEVH